MKKISLFSSIALITILLLAGCEGGGSGDGSSSLSVSNSLPSTDNDGGTIDDSAALYISPTGSDTAGDGTIVSPWFTLNKAWDAASVGDTIYLRGGDYEYTSEQSLRNKSGTSGNMINIFAYPGEQPNITRDSTWSTDTSLVYVSDSNYVYLKGIEISGFYQIDSEYYSGLVVRDSSHNIFEQLNVHDNGNGMALTQDSTDNLILNSDFHHNSDPLTGDTYGNADGFHASDIPVGNTNTIRGCRFWWNSDDGLDLWQNEGNVIIDNCWAWYNGLVPDTFNQAGDGNGFKLGRTLISDPTTVLRTVTNSVAFNNTLWGFQSNGALCNIALYNNTSYENCYQGFKPWCGGYNLYTADIAYYMKNNIALESYTETGTIQVSTNIDHNTWDSAVTLTSADFVSISTSGVDGARQADGSLPDIDFMHLVSGSDLIDAGIDVGLPYSGSAPDLGAMSKVK